MDKFFSGQFGEVLILKKIINKFPIPKTCIEFGAYDGLSNSNTYYFWTKKGFKSLLIEPSPTLFEKLRCNINKNCTINNEYVSTENDLIK